MKAAVYYTTGGPEVFRYEDVPDPVPGPGEVLVRVEAISIEGGDTLSRLGGDVPRAPHIVGYQCAGTVIGTGEGVGGLSEGDRVVTVGLDGSHAALRAVGEPFCWRIPDGLTTEEAACVPVPFGTADDCLFEFGRLQSGETALIHAGGERSGHRRHPVGQTGRGHSARHCLEPGPPRTIGPTRARPRHRLHLRGLRRVGPPADRGPGRGRCRRLHRGTHLQKSLQCLAYRGRCISFGDAGRDPSDLLDISTLRPNNQTLAGYFLGAELFTGGRAHSMIAGHLTDIAAGRLQVVIDRRYPLEQAADAHAYIESRQAFGRVVLIP